MDFSKVVNRRGTNSYKWEKYPDGILPLWVADMDFKASESVCRALQRIVDHGVIGYASTPPELVEVVIDRLQVRHKWVVDPSWIVWLPGMIPGLHSAVRTMCVDKDLSMITNTPVYRPFMEAADHIGIERINIPFKNNGLQDVMDFELMETKVKENTRIFMLCNPHNPNGRMFTEEELRKLISFCKKHRLVICSDEIHCDLIINPSREHISIASIDPYVHDNSITLLAPSKTFNIAGLGCTYAIIPNEELRDKFKKVTYGMLPPLTAFAYQAALAAYRDSEEWQKQNLDYLRGNHAYLMEEINKIEGLKMQELDATYLAWINCEKTGSEDFTQVLERHGVGVQDASHFGGEYYFRLNFGTQRSVLEEAIGRIRKAVESLKDKVL